MKSILLVTLCTFHVTFAGQQPPSWFKVCSRTDPGFNECAVKNGNEIVPKLVPGNRKFHVPVLDPFKITRLVLSNGDGKSSLSLVLRDVDVVGLKNAILRNVTSDFANQNAAVDLEVSRVSILGQYNVTGKLLLLPIRGDGEINITLDHVNAWIPFDFIKEKIDGEEYAVMTNVKINLTPKRVYIHLKNLFNGDKLLGDQMNKFLDENWNDVFNDVGPDIAATFAEAFKTVANGVAKEVTFDTLFPEKLP